MHALLFHLFKILENSNSFKWHKTDQWVPGDSGGGQGNQEERLTKKHKEILEQGIYIFVKTYQIVPFKYMQLIISQSYISKYVKNVKHHIEVSFFTPNQVLVSMWSNGSSHKL